MDGDSTRRRRQGTHGGLCDCFKPRNRDDNRNTGEPARSIRLQPQRLYYEAAPVEPHNPNRQSIVSAFEGDDRPLSPISLQSPSLAPIAHLPRSQPSTRRSSHYVTPTTRRGSVASVYDMDLTMHDPTAQRQPSSNSGRRSSRLSTGIDHRQSRIQEESDDNESEEEEEPKRPKQSHPSQNAPRSSFLAPPARDEDPHARHPQGRSLAAGSSLLQHITERVRR